MYGEAQRFFTEQNDKKNEIVNKLADYTVRIAEAAGDEKTTAKLQKFIDLYQIQKTKIDNELAMANTQFEEFKAEQNTKNDQKRADQAKDAKEREYQD